jgi:hypothetical protein
MNQDATYTPKVQDESEEGEIHLSLLIHQAGEDARIRRKKMLDEHFKKLNEMIQAAVSSKTGTLPA